MDLSLNIDANWNILIRNWKIYNCVIHNSTCKIISIVINNYILHFYNLIIINIYGFRNRMTSRTSDTDICTLHILHVHSTKWNSRKNNQMFIVLTVKCLSLHKNLFDCFVTNCNINTVCCYSFLMLQVI